MKFTTTQVLLATAPFAAAFPATMLDAMKADPAIAARAAEIMERQEGADAATALFEANPTFDAESQFIDVGPGSGHEWQAPRAGDLRGPCPGLNAFANHGLLPRTGYATISQFIDATTEVVGMGPILATFLAVLGASIDGDGLSWSIHTSPPPGVGGPLASLGRGLTGSHNKYESDASPTRGNLYGPEGNNWRVQNSQLQELLDASPNNVITLDTLTQHRSNRFDASIATNEFFFNGPFTGVLVQPAAYTFIFRFMANHTEEEPVGILTHDVFKSWFGVEGSNGNYQFVGERIPDNWYRRSRATPYESTYFLGDAAAAARLHPKFLNIGGNTNGVNTFTGVDVTDLSGGVMNGENLLDANNFACLAYQFAAQAKPDILLGALTQLTNALGDVLGPLACPRLRQLDQQSLMQFPGFARSRREGIVKK